MIIIGIDPGTQQIGFGVIDISDKSDISYASYIIAYSYELDNTILIWDFIKQIKNELRRLIHIYKPNKICIEKMFVAYSNRHMALLNIVPRIIEDTIKEYQIYNELKNPTIEFIIIANSTVKKYIAGHGKAIKSLVAKAVFNKLGINEKIIGIKKKDLIYNATDALAIALSYNAKPKEVFNL